MRRTSLTDAKARLSELVDDAEHHQGRTLILRHGKPAAAIVPASVVLPRSARRRSRESVTALLDRLLSSGDGGDAVADLLEGRR